MANILTVQEAADAVRTGTDDANVLDLLPMVDSYINYATGHDWTADTPINPTAKAAARIVLVMWHEDPAMMAQRNMALVAGLINLLNQLEAIELPEPTNTNPDPDTGIYY